ncbi:MAG TPA: chemotaxis-specific protein-glutamate methyltransferase CheB [Spirochaetota bacterium]|nr:chemotaxis-specific protein-glutamate methyltransferase CheB [Spirochaetota bacterium]HPN81867.1 chemotaxis-specific protein-glutamate methyltransferase CheB [Spirochaetota bacterium]
MTTGNRKKIRVMIVDDSLVFRTLLRDVLGDDGRIEVVTQAVNGKLALPRIRHYQPDIVILDQEMPELNGLETLELLHKDFPEIGVIMFSSHTVEGARVTIRALELGALDFVTKPDPAKGDAAAYIRRTLIPLVVELSDIGVAWPAGQKEVQATGEPAPVTKGIFGACTCCALGISTGGPAALHILVPKLSVSIRGPVVIVQHMPKLFTKQLADSLDGISKVHVVEGADGMTLEKGTVYIAPGGLQMEVVQGRDGAARLRVFDGPAENNCKPAVNVLFRSVAKTYGGKALGVIMTGMGNDGYEGLQVMKSQGSLVLGQSEKSCLIFGMPAQATREGIVDDSLDIDGLAARINYLMGGS